MKTETLVKTNAHHEIKKKYLVKIRMLLQKIVSPHCVSSESYNSNLIKSKQEKKNKNMLEPFWSPSSQKKVGSLTRFFVPIL